MNLSCALWVVSFLSLVTAGRANAEWPQFRGPNGSGVDSAIGYPVEFSPANSERPGDHLVLSARLLSHWGLPPGLCAALRPPNALLPVRRRRHAPSRSFHPRRPTAQAVAAKGTTREAASPTFSFGNLSPSRGAATQMLAIDCANGATH